MADDVSQDGSGVPEGWAPDGLLAGVPAMNAAAAQSTLPALMSPQQIADVDWNENGPAGGAGVISPAQVTPSEGGDANALMQEIDSLDPRLSRLLGPLHWVAVPNSVDQDDEAGIDPDEKPRGYPDQGYGSDLTYGDLDGAAPNSKDIIIATDGGNAGDGSYNTVFHETAHGVDELNPKAFQSDDPAFQKAYSGDVPSMTPGDDDYYLDPNSGRSESYAESFARYFGGDPTLQQDWPNMYNYWAGQYPDASPGQPWKWSEQPKAGDE